MSAVTTQGSTTTVRGVVLDKATNAPVVDVIVAAYDKDLLTEDDFLGIAPTDAQGRFEIQFDQRAVGDLLGRRPDLYFTVLDGGTLLANTRDNTLRNAGPDTPDIVILADLSNDKMRPLINLTTAPGWVGGFAQSNPSFAYPTPDLSSLPVTGNRDNIPKLVRQQDVVWPEFSWNSVPDGQNKERCYQMFAPDISRLGYDAEGRVYAIICPQQAVVAPQLGAMNVEVTVTGVRGWADETTRTLAADMSVQGRIWFSPSAHEKPMVKRLLGHFGANGLPFPSTKAKAIIVKTSLVGDPNQPLFPLIKGQTDRFPIPAFAQHNDLAFTVGHLDVEIGAVTPTGVAKVDEFNQAVLDIFNLGSGNMLKQRNVLSWNVWFTAPKLVDQAEWAAHAEYWRTSLDADHGSPDGDASPARYFDGSPFKPVKTIEEEEEAILAAWMKKHL